VQQAVLRSFASTGLAADPAGLEQAARTVGRTSHEVLAELAATDFLTLDDQGRVRAAYPFSATPTPHTVHLPDGTEVSAMCAVHALGSPTREWELVKPYLPLGASGPIPDLRRYFDAVMWPVRTGSPAPAENLIRPDGSRCVGCAGSRARTLEIGTLAQLAITPA
jgi:hypothetical protein